MNHPHYTTFFQANHIINHRSQLYFISVFIYTCIKVKLTKGEKEMASPKPDGSISADIFFWLQNNPNSYLKSKANLLLTKPRKPTPKPVNPSLILQPQSAKLFPIYLIFANRSFRSKREPFFSFSLRLKTN